MNTVLQETLPVERHPEPKPHRLDYTDVNEICLARSWWSLVPNLICYFIGCILCIELSQAYPQLVQHFSIVLSDQVIMVSLPVLIIPVALLIVRPLLLVYDSYLIVGIHEVSYIGGIFSIRMIRMEIPYQDIRGIELKQTLVDRIFNVGDYHIGTAMTEKAEIIMEGVANAGVHLAEMLDRMETVKEYYKLPRI